MLLTELVLQWTDKARVSPISGRAFTGRCRLGCLEYDHY